MLDRILPIQSERKETCVRVYINAAYMSTGAAQGQADPHNTHSTLLFTFRWGVGSQTSSFPETDQEQIGMG